MPSTPKRIVPIWIERAKEAIKKDYPESEKAKGLNHVNQKFYSGTWWVKYRKNYIVNVAGGLCEVDKAIGRLTDITNIKRGAYLDHIIRIEAGGSKTDPRNHMLMKKYWHNRKRGLEGNKSILVETIEIENEYGEKELIPKNRMEIVKVLTQ